ncbi:hypothetical protein F5148DRAFT_1283674 [Russula earlei]|uniref:Uncharacterized protein n=1 Tax=Russula earlei TaxID=71964 RepID=A0ACC0UCD1_9AGAM|nr:hypothetical protein F5148DRAFT_1283674 [Russula earlei]
MEEEAVRQAAANALPQPPPGAAAQAAAGQDGALARPSQLAAATNKGEEADLQQALREEDLMEEEMIARAIAMSVHPEAESEENK